jgi:hypothetical protein
VRGGRDLFGQALGVFVFLGGIGLLLLTFRMAMEMFGMPPERALGLEPGAAIDLGLAGQNFASLVIRVALLLVMAIVGSLVATRGIRLYSDSRTGPLPRSTEGRSSLAEVPDEL